MVISDINILCIGQKEPSRIEADGIDVEVVEKSLVPKSHFKDRAFDRWLKPFMRGRGVWYDIYSSDSSYKDELFDLELTDGKCRIIPERKHLPNVELILRQLINDSPEYSILLFVRLGNTLVKNTSAAELTLDDAIRALKDGELSFEKYYRITR